MKSTSDTLYLHTTGSTTPIRQYERCSARDLGLKEAWLRDAIFDNPEMVIGACVAAGLTDDEWYAWEREFSVEVGQIDVLLISSKGRVAIVETKLSINPEGRRRVLAQVLDYLVHLEDRFRDSPPKIPTNADGVPVASEEDVLESVANRDVLVIIASDEIDERVARLSQGMLSKHVTNQWDLALVDVALYHPTDAPVSDDFLVVPHIRNIIKSDLRQVIRVIVEGKTPKAKIQVEHITATPTSSGRQKWNKKRFFEYLQSGTIPRETKTLAHDLVDLSDEFPETVQVSWGTGKQKGSMSFKRNNGSLIEIHTSGHIIFRREKFEKALGKELAAEYHQTLRDLIPATMAKKTPILSPNEAAQFAPKLFQIIRQIIEKAEAPTP